MAVIKVWYQGDWVTISTGSSTPITFGTTAGTCCEGNDARLSDARTPLTHPHPVANETEAKAGTNNTKFMTPLSTAQAISELAGSPDDKTYVWKYQHLLDYDEILNLSTLMSTYGVGEYVFEVIGYNGAWEATLEINTYVVVSMSGGFQYIIKIDSSAYSAGSNNIGGTVEVFDYTGINSTSSWYNSGQTYTYPRVEADSGNSDRITINVYRLE